MLMFCLEIIILPAVLPVTYYKSIDQIPPFEDYDMKGRTYRYLYQEPLYPFGYGLSYTTFSYSNWLLPEKAVAGENSQGESYGYQFRKRAGDEVVQLYLTDEKASTPRPVRQLEGFSRISLETGRKQRG